MIGFIGCGNMASAMIRGMIGSGAAKAEEICASAKSEASRQRVREELGIQVLTNEEVAAKSDILFLSVKPQFYAEVIAEIREAVREQCVIVTIAPGKTLAWLADRFAGKEENAQDAPTDCTARKIIRTMPNTPAMVGEGMMGMCPNEYVTPEELAQVRKLCDGFGRTELVSEHLLDTVTAVSGSSPAYVFMFIEAMADAAVADGMPRAQAYTFAAQAVLGSAKMVLETGRHPGELKDMVCSPGGTTIEAVRVLEAKGMRSAVIEAMKACVEKGRSM